MQAQSMASTPAGSVRAEELMDVLAPIMAAVQKLAAGTTHAAGGAALQQEVQQVTGAVQVCVHGCSSACAFLSGTLFLAPLLFFWLRFCFKWPQHFSNCSIGTDY